MKVKNRYLYLSLIFIHLLILIAAFPQVFYHQANAMFCNSGDGLKNYFTLLSYVKEPISSAGIFKYNSFAYPFGDYVFYTDNTPLFSIIFKWFCLYIYNVSAYTIPFFNLFILSNIAIAGMLVFYIFKALIGKNPIAYILAITLPWVNIQLPRIWEGHYNLSLSCIILAVIALFIAWHHQRDMPLKRLAIALQLIILLFCSFLIHGYYIAITAMFLGGMLFFTGLLNIKNNFGRQSLIAALLIPITAFALVLELVNSVDKYYPLRQEHAMGYDLAVQKTNFFLLFTHYNFLHLGFPLSSTMQQSTELGVYLGNTGLLSFLTIWLGAVFNINFRRRVFAIQKSFFLSPLNKAIFWGGMLSLLISFGESYGTNRDEIKIFTPIPWVNTIDTSILVIAIFSLSSLIYGLVLLAKPAARLRLQQVLKSLATHPYKSALSLLCIALMVFLFVAQYSLTIVNIFNPFLYLHFLTRKVEQFRSLSRFSWPFFWSFYIWVMYTVVQLYHQAGIKIKNTIVALLIIISTVEITDYVLKIRREANNKNLFSVAGLATFHPLKIDFSHFQAILPIPYYTVGSEDYNHTIDDADKWSLWTMQLSLYAKLPLMACKMSRTPPAFSIAMLHLVANDSLSPLLRNRLGSRPILIAVERTLVADPQQVVLCSGERPLTQAYYKKANDFVARHHLIPIDSLGNVLFYSWKK